MKGPGIGGSRRQAVDLDASLVSTSFLPDLEGRLPLVIRPAVAHVDLAAWAAAHRDQIDGSLLGHGALLFRGFGLSTTADFERVASAVCPDLFAEYGDLPRDGESKRIYKSTPYPPELPILFHNESSHLPQWLRGEPASG